MLHLTATLPSCTSSDPRDRANVYCNVSEVGMASGAATRKVNEDPVELFPGASRQVPGYLELPYLSEEYLGEDLSDKLGLAVEIGPICFGRVRVGMVAVDVNGNEQAGTMAETEITVNSAPRPARALRRGAFAGGVQMFTFQESPTVRA